MTRVEHLPAEAFGRELNRQGCRSLIIGERSILNAYIRKQTNSMFRIIQRKFLKCGLSHTLRFKIL
jgi:hypothetical protein